MNTPSQSFQDYSGNLSNKFSANVLAKLFATQNKPDETQKQVSSGKNKDTRHTTVAHGRADKLKPNDSEADILAKMYNLMVKTRIRDVARAKKIESNKTAEKDFDDRRNEELMRLMGVEPKKSAKKKLTKSKFGMKGSLLKTGLKVGLAVVGLAAIEKAFAKISETSFENVIPNFKDTVDRILPKRESGARKIAEQYYGKEITDKEWDMLMRAVAAESDNNKLGQSRTMATILNRAKSGKFADGTIAGVLNQKNAFQAVTGTKYKPGPSDSYRIGPSESRLKSIEESVIDLLPAAPPEQLYFSAMDPKAYTKGTNIGYRNELLEKGGTVIGGQVYNAPLTKQESNYSQVKPQTKTSVITPKTIDDTKFKEIVEDKAKSELNTVVNTVNSITILQKNVVKQASEDTKVDDSSEYSKKTKAVSR